MDDLFSKMTELFENPEAMSKIKDLAESLGASTGESLSEKPSLPPQQETTPVPKTETGGDFLRELADIGRKVNGERTMSLLQSIRPFMRQSRQSKVDTAIRAVEMLGVLSKLR